MITMRKILEIIIDAKDGKIPNHEECYYALLAYASFSNFLERDFINIDESEKKDSSILLRAKLASSKMRERAMAFRNQTPIDWLGELHNPLTASGKRFSDMGNKIIDNALKRK